MRWPWQRSIPISDPVLVALFGGGPSLAGITVTESTALGVSAFWRAVNLIAGTLATLPMPTFRDGPNGMRETIPSFLDDPGKLAPGNPTPLEWKERVIAHLVIHGNAFLAHIYNQGGAIIGLHPIHPLAVGVEWEKENGKMTGRKLYRVSLEDGTYRTFTSASLTQIMGLSLDGLRGLSVLTVGRTSIGTTIAGDKAAAGLFGKGPMVSGLVSADEDIDEEEAKEIKRGIDAKVSGIDNAGEIAVINRKLKFTQWSTSNADAQFLESRQFQIEEIARWFGIPPFELMQTEKQTSWGTGIESQQQGLARTVLSPWAQRVEQPLTRLLPRGQSTAFEFAGLERGNPAEEIGLLISQVQAGIMTVPEARAVLNRPPLPEATTPPEGEGNGPAQTV
jgi:HK97 family phage portal protein